MPELSGTLGGPWFVSLLRLFAATRMTGRVHLGQDGWSGEVFVKDGEVFAASFGPASGLGAAPSDLLTGLDALEAIALGLPNATFFFTAGSDAPRRNVALSAEEVHSRLRSDLAGALTSETRLVSLTAVPRRVDLALVPLEGDEVRMDRGKLRLLLAIDGQRSAAHLAGNQGIVPTLRDLTWLASRGFVDIRHG